MTNQGPHCLAGMIWDSLACLKERCPVVEEVRVERKEGLVEVGTMGQYCTLERLEYMVVEF